MRLKKIDKILVIANVSKISCAKLRIFTLVKIINFYVCFMYFSSYSRQRLYFSYFVVVKNIDIYYATKIDYTGIQILREGFLTQICEQTKLKSDLYLE